MIDAVEYYLFIIRGVLGTNGAIEGHCLKLQLVLIITLLAIVG